MSSIQAMTGCDWPVFEKSKIQSAKGRRILSSSVVDAPLHLYIIGLFKENELL